MELPGTAAPIDASQAHRGPAPRLIGSSPGMQALRAVVQRVAPTEASVLVTGESGVGKELVARGLHELSPRSGGPFVAINCSAIPEGLIEAELFGHEKGSFTGAVRTHPGVFERGNGGTLFLDEISEMPARMQSRLLRVLQTRRFTRVGGSVERPSDVRIVAATNRNVGDAVAAGHLRQDLLYRIAVFPIHVPPLRDRGEDVVELAHAFLAELNAVAGTDKRFVGDIATFLRRHDWPGNVRELRNCIERAFILADHQVVLDEGLLLPAAREAAQAGDRLPVRVGTSLDEAERQLIMATLVEASGNKRRAAALLGCSIKTLYNKLQRYRATEPDTGPGDGLLPGKAGGAVAMRARL